MATEKIVSLQSVSPTGERSPAAVYSMTNGKIEKLWSRKGGRSRKSKKRVKVFKVETLSGPVWRTAIESGGMISTYDTTGQSGKPLYIKDPWRIQAAMKGKIGDQPIYSPALKQYIESIEFQQPSAVARLTGDLKVAVKPGRQYVAGKSYTQKKKQQSFYSEAEAQAYRRSQYEQGLAIYQGGLAWLGGKIKPRFARLAAPTMRGAARAGRGAGRALGLGGGRGGSKRAQRTQTQGQRAWQRFRLAQRQELARFKREDLDPYRETWGL